MFSIFLILSAMIGIYFCLCVQESQFTILGRIKSILKNIFQIMIMIIPERHRSVIREITNYCFYKRNPIIQVNIFLKDFIFSISIWIISCIHYVWCR